MKRLVCLTLGAASFLGVAADGPAAKKAAPAIAGMTADGKGFNLATALKTAPVFVYFISTTCPVTNEATPHYVKLAAAYQKLGMTCVGVVNANKKDSAKWAADHKLPFPVIPDPDYKILTAYKIAHAPSTVVIGKDGRVAKFWNGYSLGFLQEASKLSAKHLGKPAVALSFKGAPKETMAG